MLLCSAQYCISQEKTHVQKGCFLFRNKIIFSKIQRLLLIMLIYCCMKYLAVPQEDVKVDKLAVLLDQVTNSILFEEVVGLLLQVQTTNANILHSDVENTTIGQYIKANKEVDGSLLQGSLDCVSHLAPVYFLFLQLKLKLDLRVSWWLHCL